MGAAKGIVRRLPLDKDVIYDYIPVDIVINELIVAAWHVGTTRYAKFTLLTHAWVAYYLTACISQPLCRTTHCSMYTVNQCIVT